MSKNSIRLFRLFGIDLYIHWSWLIILVFLSWQLSSHFRDELIEEYHGVFTNPLLAGWILGVAVTVLLFASVILHEFGHSLTAKVFQMRVDGITLFLLGGVSKIEELEETSAKRDFLITVMGPIVSLVLGGVFLGGIVLWEGKEAARISLPVFLILSYLAVANFALGILNLTPAYPLDGGRLLLSSIRFLGVGRQKAQMTVSVIGLSITGAMMAAGVASVIAGWPLPRVESAWIFAIGMFLFVVNLVVVLGNTPSKKSIRKRFWVSPRREGRLSRATAGRGGE